MSPDQGIFTAVDCVRTALITWIHITHVRGRSEHIMIIAFFLNEARTELTYTS